VIVSYITSCVSDSELYNLLFSAVCLWLWYWFRKYLMKVTALERELSVVCDEIEETVKELRFNEEVLGLTSIWLGANTTVIGRASSPTFNQSDTFIYIFSSDGSICR